MGKFSNVLSKFDIRSSSGNTRQAICPAHEDHNPSLTITEKYDKLLLKCHAGCKFENIIDKVGLEKKDFFLNPKPNYRSNNYPSKVQYDYYDKYGSLSFSNIKFIDKNGKKKYSYCQYDKEGNKVWNLNGVKTVLYRLPELIEAVNQGKTIFITEGEKDCENLIELDLNATTNPFGASKWKANYNKYLEGADIIILEDNDETGRNNTELLIKELSTVANSIKLIRFTDFPEKSDVSDWLALGHSKEELLKIVEDTEYVYHKKENADIPDDGNEAIADIREYIYEGTKSPNHKRVIEIVTEKNQILVVTTGEDKYLYYIFQDGYWNYLSKHELAKLFKELLIEKQQTGKWIKEILSSFPIHHDRILSENQLNSHKTLINLENCAFDLEKYIPIPHSPDHYFNHKLPYKYEFSSSCPYFKSIINEYAGNNANWVDLLQEIMGYCLSGDFNFQVMFWFFGSRGRNGKGTTIKIIEKLVGEEFTYSNFEMKESGDNKFYKGRLINKRLITAGEIPPKLSNVHTLKSLTGGDKQTTDVKYGVPITFESNAKIIFSMNSLPNVPKGENKEPLRKRIIILPFMYQIPNPNSEILNKVYDELPGIFNWAIEGKKRLDRNKMFTKLAASETLLNSFISDDNIEEMFFSQSLTLDESWDGSFLSEIFKKYVKFMDEYTHDKYWQNKKDEYITTIQGLSLKIRQLFPVIESVKKTNGNKGQYIFFNNLKLNI